MFDTGKTHHPNVLGMSPLQPDESDVSTFHEPPSLTNGIGTGGVSGIDARPVAKTTLAVALLPLTDTSLTLLTESFAPAACIC